MKNHLFFFLNKYYEATTKQLYNIGLRLTSNISELEYEKTYGKDQIPIMKFSDLKIDEKFALKYNLTMIVAVYPNMKKLVKLKDIDNDQNILPIFLTKRELKKISGIKYKSGNVYPDVDEEKLSIVVGKRKIYTLPFWNSEQHMNMIYNKFNNKDDYIDGLYFGDLLKNSLICNYFRNKLTPNNNSINIKMSYKDRIELLLNEIKKK